MAPQAVALPVIPIDAPSSSTTNDPNLTATLTSQSVIASPTDTNDTFGGRGVNGSLNNAEGFQTSGGYIYLILVVTLLVAIVYFGRVCLAKRRERKRLLKEGCEDAVPPGYFSHLYDMQVFVTNPGGVESSHLSATEGGASTVAAVQPSAPVAAMTRTPSPCPPAYETVVGPLQPSSSALASHENEHSATLVAPVATETAAPVLLPTSTISQPNWLQLSVARPSNF
ncbi:unnamed protein product [Mortierella alpina]